MITMVSVQPLKVLQTTKIPMDNFGGGTKGDLAELHRTCMQQILHTPI